MKFRVPEKVQRDRGHQGIKSRGLQLRLDRLDLRRTEQTPIDPLRAIVAMLFCQPCHQPTGFSLHLPCAGLKIRLHVHRGRRPRGIDPPHQLSGDILERQSLHKQQVPGHSLRGCDPRSRSADSQVPELHRFRWGGALLRQQL